MTSEKLKKSVNNEDAGCLYHNLRKLISIIVSNLYETVNIFESMRLKVTLVFRMNL